MRIVVFECLPCRAYRAPPFLCFVQRLGLCSVLQQDIIDAANVVMGCFEYFDCFLVRLINHSNWQMIHNFLHLLYAIFLHYLGSGDAWIVQAGVVFLAAEGVRAAAALIPGRVVAAKASEGVNAALGVGRCDGRAGICSHNESPISDRLLSMRNAGSWGRRVTLIPLQNKPQVMHQVR